MKTVTPQLSGLRIRKSPALTGDIFPDNAEQGRPYQVVSEIFFNAAGAQIPGPLKAPYDYWHWAKIVLDTQPGKDAYICVKVYGKAAPLCVVSGSDGQPPEPSGVALTPAMLGDLSLAHTLIGNVLKLAGRP